MSKLGAPINDTQTIIPIFDSINPSELPSSGVVLIESELVRYGNTTDKELVDCIRGYNSTTATSHDQDTAVTLSLTEQLELQFHSGVQFLNGSSSPIDGTNGTGAPNAEKGSVYIDLSDGTHYTNTGTASSPTWEAAGGGGSATPAGSDSQIQYNSSGSFAGASGITTDGTNLSLTTNNKLILGNSDNAWIEYSSADGAIAFESQSGVSQLTAPTSLQLFSNSGLGSGTYFPDLIMDSDGAIEINTDDSKSHPTVIISPANLSGSARHASAILECVSTTQGFVLPRMTETQRDAIAAPIAGLMVYNTDTNKLNFYNGTSWEAVTSA